MKKCFRKREGKYVRKSKYKRQHNKSIQNSRQNEENTNSIAEVIVQVNVLSLNTNNLQKLKNHAYYYDARIEYESLQEINIGKMNIKCLYCNAMRFIGESKNMCCSSGRVSLAQYEILPQPLLNLLKNNHEKSKIFLPLLRKYNACFNMTSFQTTVKPVNPHIFTFKVQGQVYHRMGSMIAENDTDAKFLQIFFIGDEEKEIRMRREIVPDTNLQLLRELQNMLHFHNHYVRTFKTAMESNVNNDFHVVIKANKRPAGEHARVFNAPSTNEVAIIINGTEFERRDILLKKRSNELQNICETHIAYDALQYPLMFPRGEPGYCINIKQINPNTKLELNKTVSAMSYYAYKIMVREGNHLLHYRQLFHQYLVDMYAKIESERLQFIRHNQTKLRAEDYIHLKDSVRPNDNVNNFGKMVILPSTFLGGPRHLHEYTQDALTYVRHGGKPTFFITFTFNPNCKEMKENLFEGQNSKDRHDLIARIFKQKLNKLMDIIIKGQIFGKVKYYLYSIEWQKRGLPHAHILIWLEEKFDMNKIDQIISAELPNKVTDPKLFETITKNMIHGPCGHINPKSPCMDNGKCTKNFPKPLRLETQTGEDGYPSYRRRNASDGGECFEMNAKIKGKWGTVTVDNSWVVPYNPLLCRMFDSHINVEYCNSVKSIKYILKYVYKGADHGVYNLQSGEKNIDEIKDYQCGRYISTNEAVWRILSFPTHERYPAVMHLHVHLQDQQRVYFNETNLQERLARPQNTTLTAFFDLCSKDEFARRLLYNEVPQYYTFNNKEKIFQRRKYGELVEGYPEIRKTNMIGRVYTVHLRNMECFCLRILLHKIKGPTSFNDLKCVNGVIC